MDYIKHHGILGQKWGVRRFQNKDGSLTKAGEKRYDSEKQAERKSLERREREELRYEKWREKEVSARTRENGRRIAGVILTAIGALTLASVAKFAVNNLRGTLGVSDSASGVVNVGKFVGVDSSTNIPPIVIDEFSKAIIPVGR